MMKNWILHWVSSYGYIGLSVAMFLAIIGLPIPGSTLLVVSGLFIAQGKLQWLPAVIASVLGNLAGMGVTYYIGWKAGQPLLHKYGQKIMLTPDRQMKLEQWFHRFGNMIVMLGFFSANTRRFTGYLAGIHRLPRRTFFFFSLAGSFAWTVLVLLLSRYIGQYGKEVVSWLHGRPTLVIGTVSILLLGFALILYCWKKRKTA